MELPGDKLRCMAGTMKLLRCYINGLREGSDMSQK